jgi:hypothetical protein
VVDVVVVSEQLVWVVLVVDGEEKIPKREERLLPGLHSGNTLLNTIGGAVARLNKLQSISSYVIVLLAVLFA